MSECNIYFKSTENKIPINKSISTMTYVYNDRSVRNDYSDRDRVVMIPPTTDMALIFPYDKSKKQFDRNFFSSALTDGRLSSEQLEAFMEKIERKVNNKVAKVEKVTRFFKFLAMVSVMMLVFFGIVVFSQPDFDDDLDYAGDDIDVFFTAFMGFMFGFVFYAILLSIFSKRAYRKARKNVERYLNKHNPEFAAMGLRWNIPMSFPQWIELWKDYKGQNNTFGQNQLPQQQFQPQYQPQHAYTLPIQPKNQYPILPPLMHKPSNNQTTQNNPMNQPLLAQQNQDPAVYIPPTNLNYTNYEN